MRTLRLTCAYDGTDYAGFQRQANGRSIQELLEAALSFVLNRPICVAGAGRTDAGVHATGQVASFVTDSPLCLTSLLRGVNSRLPDEIRVIEIAEAPEGFHARFSAVGKCYEYTIIASPINDVFLRRYSWHIPTELDMESMASACSYLVGRRDFAAMQAAGSPRRNTVRTLSQLAMESTDLLGGKKIVVTATADGFLYRMVRNIVGVLVEVGRGRIDAGRVEAILASGDRSCAPATAPARGLVLKQVHYITH